VNFCINIFFPNVNIGKWMLEMPEEMRDQEKNTITTGYTQKIKFTQK
jgi:hypothetical protein